MEPARWVQELLQRLAARPAHAQDAASSCASVGGMGTFMLASWGGKLLYMDLHQPAWRTP